MENLIECNPKIMLGKPVIKGTRIKVEMILQKFAAGESIEEILSQHPRLTREMVLACFDFAIKSRLRSFISRRVRRGN